ncbi:MAG: hypothetical protein LBQ33_04355 [Oscillospiraceae bacterium]|jgi:signal peptidase I|nr:hypothetical protein [Oscillospiraceae bacterium]
MPISSEVRTLPYRNRAPEKSTPQLSLQGEAFVQEIGRLAEEVLGGDQDAQDGLPAPLFSAPPNAARARRVKITSNVFFYAALCFSLLLALTVLLNRTAATGIAGLRFFVEQTDAMQPLIPRGALLITKTTAPEKTQPGDVITYYALSGQPDSRLTRVVAERLDNYSGDMTVFRTRRANGAQDSILVNQASVLGVKLAAVPFGGMLLSFTQSYAGALAVLAASLCVAAVLLRKWLRGAGYGAKRKGQKNERTKQEG